MPDLDVVFADNSVLVARGPGRTSRGRTLSRRLSAGAWRESLLALWRSARAPSAQSMAISGSECKVFLSFAVESFGGLGEEALKLLDMVALTRGCVHQISLGG